jgi:hypothetical protein
MKLGGKGTMIDIFYLILVFMFFGIMALVSVYLKDQIFPQLVDVLGNGTTSETILNTAEQGYQMMDNLFMMLYFVLAGVSIIFAALVRTNPAFFVLNIIMLFVLFLIAPAMSNVMREFWATPEFAQYAAGGGGSITYPIMTRVFQYLPHITVGISVLLILAQFSKGFSTNEM